MSDIVLVIFALTYAGMALGRVPGLRTDRAGIALLAAVAILVATGTDVAAAAGWLDLPTLALLFGLMVLSGQFAVSGFYDACARRISGAAGGPARLLAVTVAVGGGLSAVLANDIIAFAVTPLLCLGLKARRLDPVPFLIGLAAATNVGSAATIVGNPQNILIGQLGGLDFWRFLLICGVPAALGLGLVHLVVWLQWRGRWAPAGGPPPAAPGAAAPLPIGRRVLVKAILATALLLAAFGVGLPRDLAALTVAAALFLSRSVESRALFGAVDWSLLVLFAGLFVVTGAVAALPETGALFARLAAAGWLPDRLALMAPLTLAMSNSIGNVPAVILLLQLWPGPPEGALYGLALLSTLAGNLLITGSLANIIVAERAASVGVRLGFLAHARAGIPITLATTAVALLWLWATGTMPW